MLRKILRGLKFAALGLVALLSIAMIWFAIVGWLAHTRLSNKVAELKQRQLPTSLADLKRTPPPPEKNAVTYLRRAKSDVDQIVAEVDRACRAAGDTDDDSSQYSAIWAGHPAPAILAEIRRALASHPEAVPLLLQASECPDYDWQYDFTGTTLPEKSDDSVITVVLESGGEKRQAIRVLYHQVLAHLSEGKTNEALDICLAMLRLNRAYAQDPLMLHFLVNVAVYKLAATEAINLVLRSGTLTAEQHQQLDEALAAADLPAQFRHAMMTERAYSLTAFDEMRGKAVLLAVTAMPGYQSDTLSVVNLFDVLADNADRPFDGVLLQEMGELEKQGGVFTSLLVPALSASRGSLASTLACQRSARVLNRLLERDPKGEKQLSIEQLGLPPEVTIDPFGGQPLHIKHTPAGPIVYSVGKNLKDDGGRLDDDATDEGLGPIPTDSSASPAGS